MESAPSRSLPVWFLLLGTLGAIIGFCWSEQDYVAATALAGIAAMGAWGYCVGALRFVSLVIALAAAYAGSVPLGAWVAPHLGSSLGTTAGTTNLFSSILVGALLMLVVSGALAIVARSLLRDRPQLQATNRLLGFGFGGLQGAAAMLLAFQGVLLVEPYAIQRINSAREAQDNVFARVVAARVVDIAKQTRTSTIAPILKAYDPMKKLPRLREFQKISFGNSRKEANAGCRSGSCKQNKSEVRTAIESLALDPQLRKLAQSKQSLDQKTAASLLNHPAIAKLLEHPDLMRQLSEAMNDLNVEAKITPLR